MATQQETKVLDVAGEELKVGDIVYRAKYSYLVIHRITRFTKKSIFLSTEVSTHNGVNYRQDTYLENSLIRHSEEFSFPKYRTNREIIKKQYHGDPTDFVQIGQQVQAQSI